MPCPAAPSPRRYIRSSGPNTAGRTNTLVFLAAAAAMADYGDLEDGESYLPSGILVGDDGRAGDGDKQPQRNGQLLGRQSFFSDGVGGLSCYPPELPPFPGVVSPAVLMAKGVRRLDAQSQRARAAFAASRLHFQHKAFEMRCVYGGMAPEAASGFGNGGSCVPPVMGRVLLAPDAGVYAVGPGFLYPLLPVKAGYAQVENRARRVQRPPPPPPQAPLHPYSATAKGQKCVGTGVFLPLPRHQTDPWKVATRAAPRQQGIGGGGPAAKRGGGAWSLPPDWTY